MEKFSLPKERKVKSIFSHKERKVKKISSSKKVGKWFLERADRGNFWARTLDGPIKLVGQERTWTDWPRRPKQLKAWVRPTSHPDLRQLPYRHIGEAETGRLLARQLAITGDELLTVNHLSKTETTRDFDRGVAVHGRGDGVFNFNQKVENMSRKGHERLRGGDRGSSRSGGSGGLENFFTGVVRSGREAHGRT